MAETGELDLRQTGDLMRFTIAVNFCGLPAISVPVGHSAQGGSPSLFSTLLMNCIYIAV